MTEIKTWNQRCEEHPDHQSGMVTHQMIQDRMQEEIDELRAQPKYKRVDLKEFIENYVDEYVVDDFKAKYGDLYVIERTEK